MNRKLTTKEKILWAEGCNDMEMEWGTHCYYHATEDRPGYPSSLRWSKRSDCTATHSFGCLVGYEWCDKEWTEGCVESMNAEYDSIVKFCPEIAEVGRASILGLHCIASGVIEVAKDGKSAKTYFYTPGLIGGNITFMGTKMSRVMWERYSQDWLFEDGEWRVFHNRVAEDFCLENNSRNFAEEEHKRLMRTGYLEAGMMGQMAPRNIEIPGPSHMDYSTVQVVQRDMPVPEPYDTLESAPCTAIPAPGNGQRYTIIPDIVPTEEKTFDITIQK